MKIRHESELEVCRLWLRENKIKNGRVKHILKHARKAVQNSSTSESGFVWLYPEGVSDPPVNILQVQIELVTDSSHEIYSSVQVPPDGQDYTAEEIAKILDFWVKFVRI